MKNETKLLLFLIAGSIILILVSLGIVSSIDMVIKGTIPNIAYFIMGGYTALQCFVISFFIYQGLTR